MQKTIFTFLLLFFFTFSLIAQQTEKPLDHEYIQEMGATLEKLNDHEQAIVLAKALLKTDEDIKKLLATTLKKLSKEEQELILQQAKNMEQFGAYPPPPPPPIAVAPAAVPASPAYEVPTGPLTQMTFEATEFDFGNITQGEKVTHVYKFTNTGNEPLIISKAKGSCGCTVPTWPKEPIAPGASGEIEVKFDSKGKKKRQTKRITITANTDPLQTFLIIKGEVLVPETIDEN